MVTDTDTLIKPNPSYTTRRLTDVWFFYLLAKNHQTISSTFFMRRKISIFAK